MENAALKCVLVIDEALPVGLAVNTAAVLSVTLGRRIETMVGPDVVDASARVHVGITQMTLPILKAPAASIKTIWHQAREAENLFIVDFSHVAQQARTYETYTQWIAELPTEELTYLGVALYGDKKAINRLTGNLPLL